MLTCGLQAGQPIILHGGPSQFVPFLPLVVGAADPGILSWSGRTLGEILATRGRGGRGEIGGALCQSGKYGDSRGVGAFGLGPLLESVRVEVNPERVSGLS